MSDVSLDQVAIDIYTFLYHPFIMYEMALFDYTPLALFSFGPAWSIPKLEAPFGSVN
jgi:hypothetical protein